MTEAIVAKDLTRYYGLKRGVRELDLTVPAGTIIGLLGENGCGKTTALKLAMGALLPDRGEVRTLGVDPAQMAPQVRARIGWLSDGLAVPNRMMLRDTMELQAALVRGRFQVLQEDEVAGAWRAVVADFAPEKLDGLEAVVEHLNLEELFLVYNSPARAEAA